MVNSDACCVPSRFLAMTVCRGQEGELREYDIHGLFSYSLETAHDLDQGMQRKAETGEKAECTRRSSARS
jgi:hypothetical protein